MHRICLAIILGLFFLVVAPANAAEDKSPETQDTCDPESDDTCEVEEEELERGFDPCLINAALPACKSKADGEDSASAERTPSDTEDPGDSG